MSSDSPINQVITLYYLIICLLLIITQGIIAIALRQTFISSTAGTNDKSWGNSIIILIISFVSSQVTTKKQTLIQIKSNLQTIAKLRMRQKFQFSSLVS